MKPTQRNQRRSARPSGPAISLFPFLAVLICTMGALVPLLLAISRTARLQAEARAMAQVSEQDGEIQTQREDVRWRIEQLRQSRTKTEQQLAEARLDLGHIEDHSRRLRDQLAQYERTVKDLEKNEKNGQQQVAQSQAELDRLRAQIDMANRQLVNTRQTAAGRNRSFAVVPYEGPNQTRRRPIYLECRADSVVLQPEGLAFTISDFEGPLGPGNPLAASLRAAREYLLAKRDFDPEAGEPYPMLLVRPEGIAAYYAARAAMQSWGFEFGYELVGDDWKLAYPKPDGQLANEVRRVVSSARIRQAQIVASAPREYEKHRKEAYRGSQSGGFGGDDGPEDDGDRRATGAGGSSGYGGRSTGGDERGGNDGAVRRTASSGRSGGSRGGNGNPEYNPYLTAVPSPSIGSAQGAGGIAGANVRGGNGSSPGDGYSAAHAGGNGVRGTGAGGFGESGVGGTGGGGTGVANANGGSAGGVGGNGPVFGSSAGGMPAGSAGGMPAGSVGGMPAGSAGGNGPNIGGGDGQNIGGGNPTTDGPQLGGPNGSYASGNAGAGNDGRPCTSNNNGQANGAGVNGSGGAAACASSNARSQNATANVAPGGVGSARPEGYVAGQPAHDQPNRPTAPPSDEDGPVSRGYAMRPGEWQPTPEPPPKQPKPKPEDEDDKRKKLKKSAVARHGDDWGLRDVSRGAVGVTRPVRVECYADRLVIVSDRGPTANQVIPMGPRTDASVDEFINGVWNIMDGWGIAGRGMYWKPVLQFSVAPDAERRFEDMSTLLESSGLTVQRQ